MTINISWLLLLFYFFEEVMAWRGIALVDYLGLELDTIPYLVLSFVFSFSKAFGFKRADMSSMTHASARVLV